MTDSGPGALKGLLDEYERLLTLQGFPLSEALNPGAPEAEVRKQLDKVGLVAPDELVVWFGWHNGQPTNSMPPTATASAIQVFLSVGMAVEDYIDQPFVGPEPWSWHPEWLRLGETLAVCCGSSPAAAPRVRAVFPDHGTQTGQDFYERVSLCTPVRYMIANLESGAHRWDPNAQAWQRDASALALLPQSNGFV